MVALVGALGFLHLAQQRVHFRRAEQAAGAYSAVAGHRRQLGDAVLVEFGDQRARQRA